jgi:UDP-sugar pyrophosphorylase
MRYSFRHETSWSSGMVFRGQCGCTSREGINNVDAAPHLRWLQAIGAIATLRHHSGHTLTVNVEYNQLDPLLRSTVNKLGDVNDATGQWTTS